jgi:hypothetical protein
MEHIQRARAIGMSAEFLSAIINVFEANKRLADRAVVQVPDDKLHVALDENTNSIAIIMKQDRLPDDRWGEAVAESGR